jgi:hypothetical protein
MDELQSPETRKLRALARQSLRDGVAWLGANFSVRENPGMGAAWHYYYLYGLERAGVLARVVFMGEHRWYAEGAKFLVDCQHPSGEWTPAQPAFPLPPHAGAKRAGALVDQSFALLFLARATARALGVATEPTLLDLSAGKDLNDEEFAKLFAAAVAEYDRLSGAGAEKRAREFARMGPRVVPKLLPGLCSSDAKVRRRSVTILRAATGRSFGYDPDAPRAKRESAADRWTAWYLAHRENPTRR